MRRIDESKEVQILEYIDRFFGEHSSVPSVRDISSGTGISVSTVHRYLIRMKDSGVLEYNGRRSISTKRIALENAQNPIAVIGYVSCGLGEEEQESIVEYIRMPESLVGNGQFFALVAKGESMIDAGIYPGDYVFVKKQNVANNGDIIVALQDCRSNLKMLIRENGEYVLRSCNTDKSRFPDIPISHLQIQGVATGVFHSFINVPIPAVR